MQVQNRKENLKNEYKANQKTVPAWLWYVFIQSNWYSFFLAILKFSIKRISPI